MRGERARTNSVPRRSPARLVVRAISARATTGFVEIGPYRFRCALGRSGVAAIKREGDGASPRGRWRARLAFYDAAQVSRPATGLPVRAVADDDGWCDAPLDRNYNRQVWLPYPASAERLRRDDGLYDYVVVVDYNERPRARGRGSAIFLHVARPDYAPTEGCVALSREHLKRVLALLRRGATIDIRV